MIDAGWIEADPNGRAFANGFRRFVTRRSGSYPLSGQMHLAYRALCHNQELARSMLALAQDAKM